MKKYQLIKTMPNESKFEIFKNLPTFLYPQDSMRFVLGHDPVLDFLEGCYVLLRDEQPVGRFAFYENPDLKYKDQPAACIGSYECIEDEETSTLLLEGARNLAAQKGYQWLIGPMEGSTTNNYRFSNHNHTPNFFLEPYHHIYYNKQFQEAGFESIANYFSNRDEQLQFKGEKLPQLEQSFLAQGAVIRNLDIKNIEKDLHGIGQLCKEAFAKNFLYTPIQSDSFVEKYAKLSKYFDPQLVWIVEDARGTIQAFLFAIKNYCDPNKQSLIIKSMARKSTSSFKGIGSLLSAKVTSLAKKMGYKNMIHAFIFQDNASLKISKKFTGEAFKSYSLYGLQTGI